jgi:RNA polymerase sigma-70 factor (ECF subfamily)
VTHLNAQRLQELIDHHGPALALYVQRWCRGVEDAVQEAFIQLARQDPPPQIPVAWLYLAARRRAMNQARSEQRRARHQRLAGQHREVSYLPPGEGPGEQLDVPALLDQLPDLEREIVIARIWGELSFAQIAELVHQPLSTVHRRYQKALTELERILNATSTRTSHEPRT